MLSEDTDASDIAGRVDTQILASITKQEILDLFDKRISPLSSERSKLSIHLCSQLLQSSVFDPIEAQGHGEDAAVEIASGVVLPTSECDDEDGDFVLVTGPLPVTSANLGDRLYDEQNYNELMTKPDDGDTNAIQTNPYGDARWDAVSFIDDLHEFKDTMDIATVPDDEVL